MKKIVWANKSNGQLCVTIPKNSGFKEGDVVSVEKQKIQSIVYTPMAADLFHYGHFKILEAANNLGDFHICGVITDMAMKEYRQGSLASYKERAAIISSLRCVDMIMPQDSKSAEENLKKIHAQFQNAKIILVHGSNWKTVPGQEYLKKINGELVLLPYYEKLSDKKILHKLKEMHERGAQHG